MPPRRFFFFFFFWGEQQLSNYIPSQKFRVVYCKIPSAFFFGVPPTRIRAELFRSSFQSFVFFSFKIFLGWQAQKASSAWFCYSFNSFRERDKTQWNYEISLHTFIGIFSPCVSLETRTCQPSQQSRQRKQNRSSLSLSLSPQDFISVASALLSFPLQKILQTLVYGARRTDLRDLCINIHDG